MNESTPPPKVAAWSWALLALPLIALLAYTYSSRDGGGGTSVLGDAATEFAFDPSNVKELEIKGAPPDVKSSWSEVPVPASPPQDEKLLARGKDLYTKACAACHGADG